MAHGIAIFSKQCRPKPKLNAGKRLCGKAGKVNCPLLCLASPGTKKMMINGKGWRMQFRESTRVWKDTMILPRVSNELMHLSLLPENFFKKMTVKAADLLLEDLVKEQKEQPKIVLGGGVEKNLTPRGRP